MCNPHALTYISERTIKHPNTRRGQNRNHAIARTNAARLNPKKRGMTLFVLRGGIVSPVEYDKSDAVLRLDGTVARTNSVTIQKGDFYVQALNKKNAERRLRNLGKL